MSDEHGRVHRAVTGLLRRLHPGIRHIDSRLGSPGDERPAIHQRLDVLERYGAHVSGQNDRNLQAVESMANATVGQVELLRLAIEDLVAQQAPQAPAGGAPAAAELAFTAAALAALPVRSAVLVSGSPYVAAGLSALGLDVAVLDDHGTRASGLRVIARAAAAARRWDAVVLLGPVPEPALCELVAPGGVLVEERAWPAADAVAGSNGWHPQRSAVLFDGAYGWVAGRADEPLAEEGRELRAVRLGDG